MVFSILSSNGSIMSFIKQNHCIYSLHYHLVLVTKYREKCISHKMLCRLDAIARQRCTDWHGQLIEFNGEPDHVHLLMSLPPATKLSSFVNNLKTTSSRLIRKEFAAELRQFYWKSMFWSRSYCIVSSGGVSLTRLKEYIDGQNGCA